jgi:hypothetical protein
MKRTPVVSSNIAAVGWEPGPVPWIGTMEVEFTRGAVYRYLGVTLAVTKRVLVGSLLGSVGHTFHVLVRRVDYLYERVP